MISTIRRVVRTVRQHGVRAAVARVSVALADRWFDFRHGVETCQWVLMNELGAAGRNVEHGSRYEPARVAALRKLFAHLKTMTSTDGVFVDLGSGKGRVLLIASEFGFREARGVEFSPALCACARQNCDRYTQATGTATRFSIYESDVVEYAIQPVETVFFLFNPFDDFIFSTVLKHILESLVTHPRRVLICLHNPDHESILERESRFARVSDLHWCGYRFVLYSSVANGSVNT